MQGFIQEVVCGCGIQSQLRSEIDLKIEQKNLLIVEFFRWMLVEQIVNKGYSINFCLGEEWFVHIKYVNWVIIHE